MIDCRALLDGTSDRGKLRLHPFATADTRLQEGPTRRLIEMHAESLAPQGIQLLPHPGDPMLYAIMFNGTRTSDDMLGILFDEFNPRMQDMHRTTSRIAFLEDAEFKGRALFLGEGNMKFSLDCSDYASGTASGVKGDGIIYSENADKHVLTYLTSELQERISECDMRFIHSGNEVRVQFPDATTDAGDIQHRLNALYDAMAEIVPTLPQLPPNSNEGGWWKTGGNPPEWRRG